MGTFKRGNKRILVFVIGLLLIISQTGLLSESIVYGATSDSGSTEHVYTLTDDYEAAQNNIAAAEGETVLAFTSDVHNQENHTAEGRLGTWIDIIKNKYGNIEVMTFAGDMGEYNSSLSMYWDQSERCMKVVAKKNLEAYYTNGNHEHNPGEYFSQINGSNSVADQITLNDWCKEGSNYRIYCMGAENNDNTHTESQINTLQKELADVGNDKPIFIVTHFPLHYYKKPNSWSSSDTRTITNADKLIDVLNEAVDGADKVYGTADDRKIVLLWGHNHTLSDTYYDGIYKPNDSIEYKSGSNKTFKFYYCAAGCMSDSEKGTGSASVKGKGLVITVNNNNKLTFTYYDANGNNVTEGGTYTEKDPVAVTGLTIDEAAGSGSDGLSVEVRRTLKLHATIEPSDATEDTVSWSSSDTSIASVSSTGEVKGVNPGTVDITAQVTDRVSGNVFTAVVPVTVNPRSGNDPAYVLTNQLKAGKKYIIASKNTGEAYALTNNSGTVASTAVTIDNGTIYTDNENIVFTAEGSGGTVSGISNGDLWLKTSSSSLTLSSTALSNRTWSYNSNNYLTCKENNNTYYLYYSNNNGFTSTSNTWGSSNRAIYIFEEYHEHSYGDPTYTWSDNNSTCTATRVCKNDSTHTETETATATLKVTKEPSCTAAGEGEYTANFSNTAFATQTKKGTVAAKGHSYAEPTWSWADDHRSATAKFTCKAGDDTKNVTDSAPTESVVSAATCTADKVVKYTAKVTLNGKTYTSTTANVSVSGTATGHSYGEPTWSWTNDHKSATARFTCKSGDDTKNVTDSTPTENVVSAATCTADKVVKYTVTVSFNGKTYTNTTDNVTVSGTATGHSYGEPTWSWANDHKSATAKFTCTAEDDTKSVTDSAPTESVVSAATCTADKVVKYTAKVTLNGKTYTNTSENITVSETATGHDWGDATYSWAQDNSSVTATRECRNDASHKETETVKTTSRITTSAGCETKGKTTYTATFTNNNFSTQTRTVENIPATGHSYGEPTWSWANDHKLATAKFTCTAGDDAKSVTDSAPTESVVSAATCTADKVVKYTAIVSFNDKTYTNTTANVTVSGTATGHDWGDAFYSWAQDNSSVTATRVCGNDANHKETETVNTTSAQTKDPTCETKGETTYTSAAFSNEAFEVQTKIVDNINALGHKWKFDGFVWTGNDIDGYIKASANYECERSAEHTTSEDADIVKESTEDSCTIPGTVKYTAVISASDSPDKTYHEESKTVTGVARGHIWTDAVYTWADDYSQVTAYHSCYCGSEDSEVSETTNEVTSPAGCEEVGIRTFTAIFTKEGFKKQTMTEDIPALGHDWSEWVEVIPATGMTEGVKERICSRCSKSETAKIDPLTPDPDPTPTSTPAPTPASGGSKNHNGRDGTPVGSRASAAVADKAITSMTSDTDLPGTVFSSLSLRSSKQTSTSIKLNWTAAGGAVKYVVYGNKCGKGIRPQKLATVTGNTLTLTTAAGQKLKKGTYYKFMVVALDANNNVVSTSKLIHVATKGGKVGNSKSVKVDKKAVKKAKKLKVGKSVKLKAKAVPQSKKLKMKKHVGVRYESSNANIATVSSSGKVTAKSKGTCCVYVYAQNGVSKKIKVTVK